MHGNPQQSPMQSHGVRTSPQTSSDLNVRARAKKLLFTLGPGAVKDFCSSAPFASHSIADVTIRSRVRKEEAKWPKRLTTDVKEAVFLHASITVNSSWPTRLLLVESGPRTLPPNLRVRGKPVSVGLASRAERMNRAVMSVTDMVSASR